MLNHITFNLSNSPVRHETLQGRKYLVAPMAMITEGVHNGSNGPLLYEEADIREACPAWNMKPIVVYHPTINDQGISAADAVVLEKQQVGMVMHTEFRDGKLRAEAWIEESRAMEVDDRVLDALTSNRVMEVSTGLFTTNDDTPGEWNGEEYTAIARNHQPDHLALLPDQIGACSVADGAGLLVANAGGDFEGAEVLQVARRIVGNKMSHGNISSKLNAELQKKVPRVRKGTGEDAYTVGPWIVDVYDKFFIYEIDGTLYRLNYTSGKAGVEITGDADEVVRVTEYRTADTGKFVGNDEATTNSNKDKTMNKEEIVDGLIANSATPWGEDDRDALMKTDEAILNKMASKGGAAEGGESPEETEAKAKGKGKVDNAAGAEAPKAEEAAPAAPAAEAAPTANTTQAYIDAAPPEIQQVLQNGLSAHNAEQDRLVKEITANEGNTFTEEFLRTKGIDELKGIAALAAKPTANADPTSGGPAMFIGAATPAGPTANAGATTEEALEAPALNFEKDQG